jgi:hypothetical protein
MNINRTAENFEIKNILNLKQMPDPTRNFICTSFPSNLGEGPGEG